MWTQIRSSESFKYRACNLRKNIPAFLAFVGEEDSLSKVDTHKWRGKEISIKTYASLTYTLF